MRRGALGSSLCANFAIFVLFSRILSSWNALELGRIFSILYCLQKPFKNHYSSFFIYLILHVMSCFVDLHDFSIKNVRYLRRCMIYNKSELQRHEWKQYKMLLKPLTISLYDSYMLSIATKITKIIV